MIGCITKASRSLRKRALRLGKRTFAQKPGEFADTVVRWREEG